MGIEQIIVDFFPMCQNPDTRRKPNGAIDNDITRRSDSFSLNPICGGFIKRIFFCVSNIDRLKQPSKKVHISVFKPFNLQNNQVDFL